MEMSVIKANYKQKVFAHKKKKTIIIYNIYWLVTTHAIGSSTNHLYSFENGKIISKKKNLMRANDFAMKVY